MIIIILFLYLCYIPILSATKDAVHPKESGTTNVIHSTGPVVVAGAGSQVCVPVPEPMSSGWLCLVIMSHALASNLSSHS